MARVGRRAISGSAKELYCSTSLKKMELIFICKADLKIHPVKRSQEVYRFKKVSPLSSTISKSGHCALEFHSKWVLPDLARSPQAWVTYGVGSASGLRHRRQRHSSLGYRLKRLWNLSEPHHGVLPLTETRSENTPLFKINDQAQRPLKNQ